MYGFFHTLLYDHKLWHLRTQNAMSDLAKQLQEFKGFSRTPHVCLVGIISVLFKPIILSYMYRFILYLCVYEDAHPACVNACMGTSIRLYIYKYWPICSHLWGHHGKVEKKSPGRCHDRKWWHYVQFGGTQKLLGYSTDPGHRNWQIESQAGIGLVSSLRAKKPAGIDLGSFVMIHNNFSNIKSLKKNINLVKNQD